ncbi:MAG: hypothetical protein KME05_12230 [Gloeocapsa sp. UFS-A4-WI-NPMV-4B04]|nr:hypothetical protein [Gloeocapsa sp. UFS-A4-WI-NPMV-4B04]
MASLSAILLPISQQVYCRDEQEKRWFLEFLGSYNSSWLVSLGSSGKFPWIANLLQQVEAQK